MPGKKPQLRVLAFPHVQAWFGKQGYDRNTWIGLIGVALLLALLLTQAKHETFAAPEQPLPLSGEMRQSGNLGPLEAPFEIKSAAGAHFLVKLTDLSTRQYLLVFVRGGSSVTVQVPLGNYKVTYASGTHWYGLRSQKNISDHTPISQRLTGRFRSHGI